MVDIQIIKELLHLLEQRKSRVTWQLSCIYSDARGEPLYEVCLRYPSTEGKVRKKLIFKGNTGELVSNGCYTNEVTAPTGIEDALLDLINDA